MINKEDFIKRYVDAVKSDHVDPLSGLENPGVFMAFLDECMLEIADSNELLFLAFINIDSFFNFNKKFGTFKGDLALKNIGRIILRCIEEKDLGARISGDSFTIIFQKTDIEKVGENLNRLRAYIKKLFEGSLTVSIGVASSPTDAVSSDKILRKAREALFQAKLMGNGEMCFYHNRPNIKSTMKPEILIVDDDPTNLKMMKAQVGYFGYECLTASSGISAISIIKESSPDLILLDVMMPDMNGFEVCKHLKGKEKTRHIPIILLTALDDKESKIKGIEAGADDFISKPPDHNELIARIRSLINVKHLNNNLASFENILFSIANAVEAKDRYTRGHIKRVADLGVLIGRSLGMLKQDIESLWIGGILHDIGKIQTPINILNKPGKLTPEETAIMQLHASTGYQICYPLKNNLGKALHIIRNHHEYLDGSGYPDGLEGDEISLSVRIMVVVDIYDALTTDRPYRGAMPKEKAFEILTSMADDNKIDRSVVNALFSLTTKKIEVAENE